MKRIFLLCILICLVFSCDDEVVSTIPWSPVDLKLNLNAEDHELNASLAYKTFTTPRAATDKLGYGGILVINGFGGNVVNLYAYDLSCPTEAEINTKVVPDNKGQATCPKCKAVYNIASGGAPASGSKYYLRQYTVTPDQIESSRFRIFN